MAKTKVGHDVADVGTSDYSGKTNPSPIQTREKTRTLRNLLLLGVGASEKDPPLNLKFPTWKGSLNSITFEF